MLKRNLSCWQTDKGQFWTFTFTNDGDLAFKLTHRHIMLKRIYCKKLTKDVKPFDIKKL